MVDRPGDSGRQEPNREKAAVKGRSDAPNAAKAENIAILGPRLLWESCRNRERKRLFAGLGYGSQKEGRVR